MPSSNGDIPIITVLILVFGAGVSLLSAGIAAAYTEMPGWSLLGVGVTCGALSVILLDLIYDYLRS